MKNKNSSLTGLGIVMVFGMLVIILVCSILQNQTPKPVRAVNFTLPPAPPIEQDTNALAQPH